MAQFGGDWRKEQRVSLAGRSRTEETRAQVLERTRQERERRRQEKLELRSASLIQAVFRGWRARQRHKSEVRQEWLAQYGRNGERACSDDISPSAGFLRKLCYLIDVTSPTDVLLLASACRLILQSVQPANGEVDSSLGGAPEAPRLQFCMYATAGQEQSGAVLQQSGRLLVLCLATLAHHAQQLALELRQPRKGWAPASVASDPAAPIVEVVLQLTALESWKPALGVAASAAVVQLLAACADHGLFWQLASIAAAACPEDEATATGTQRKGVPGGEALATALTVRFLSQQQAVARLQQRERAPGMPADRQLPVMLCLPLLLQRMPTLMPVAPRLWRQTVSALADLPPPLLADWLQAWVWPASTSRTSATAAAAALLGNLLEGAVAALKTDNPQQLASARQPALQFTALASSLLTLLPRQPFFPSASLHSGASRWADDDIDYETGMPAAAEAAEAIRLPWDPEQLPSSGLMSQLQLVASGVFLRALVRAILPADSIAADGGLQSQQGPQLLQMARDVRKLCDLLQHLLDLPGQRQRVLLVLAFSAELVQRLWFSYLRQAAAAPGEGWVPSTDEACDPGWMLPLTLFSLAYSSFITTADDDELYQAQRPLPLTELHSTDGGGRVLAVLKLALWNVLWVEVAPSPGGWTPPAAALRSRLKDAAGRLMGQLFDRNCRRAFAPVDAFHADALPADRFQMEIRASATAGRQFSDSVSGRAWGLLYYAPFLVPFRERAKLFQTIVSRERAAHLEMEAMHAMAHELGGGNRFFPIKRTQVLQDAFDKLNGLGEALRGRIRIQFIDAYGLEEAGVDGGGIFKEFLESVVKEGFDPALGLFKATTDNRLYPNPHAQMLMGNALRLLEFLGQVLGKAMYEGILVELPLAPFFLKKFRGAYCDINDLPTLDPQLHRNLVFLKTFKDDVADLGLSFTITDSVLGKPREVDLAPNGYNIPVTVENRLAYIHRVADYRLNQQIWEPAAAFLRGLNQLIQPEWVRMFNEEELQMLISGGDQGLDIADMRANVQYSGGYHEEHPVIQEFWRALATFTPHEQADFLRFVTSCPRPPLLGFRYLEPPFAIQLAGSMLDDSAQERLPTSATCLNLLKLPPYRTAQQIRDKLLYALKSGAGFELS